MILRVRPYRGLRSHHLASLRRMIVSTTDATMLTITDLKMRTTMFVRLASGFASPAKTRRA